MPIIDAWYVKAGYPEGISTINDFFKIAEFWSAQGLGRCWFRGESADFGDTRLKPKIARRPTPAFTTYQNMNRFTDEEDMELKRCQQELKSANFTDPFLEKFVPQITATDVNWIPLAQHYGYETRLLDVTKNALVALWFAVSSSHNQDGFVYLFPENSYRPQKRCCVDPGAIETRIPDCYHELFEDDPSRYHADIGYLFCPVIPNSRIIAQQGAFIWWHPIGKSFPNQIFPILVKASAKSTLLKNLAYFGIDEQSLFPYQSLKSA